MAKVKCPNCAHLNESGCRRCTRCSTLLPSVSFQGGVPPAEGSQQLRRGQVLNNRYTVLDIIGRGGMGRIYKVHDNVLGEDLALKTLLPQYVTDKMVSERFLNEARITRKLTHPNIVRMHDIGALGKGIYISMEYVEGDSLRAVLTKQRPGERLPVRQVLHIMDELCAALDYAHQYTIHRDIKPENVMLTRDNRVKLMDFGISKLKDNRYATAASMVMGTPYYMSPEQLRDSRDVDARSDIYSLGVVMYELLTGDMPTGVPRAASQILEGIPPALDGIVAKCVDPDREKRFESAGALRAALRPIIEMLDDGADPDKALGRRPGLDREKVFGARTLTAWGLAAFVLVLAALGLYAFEVWNRSAVGPDMPAPVRTHRLGDNYGDRYLELEQLIQSAHAAVSAREAPESQQQGLFETGAARYDEARSAALNGAASAIPLAEDALQHYLAMLLAPADMVFVGAGTVVIEGEEVYVPGFFMDETEVTLRQFAKFAREVEGGWPLPEPVRDNVDAYPDHPISFVSWFDAQAYAAWADKTLPTRAQWARAAYGGRGASDIYPWGDSWEDDAANVQTAYMQEVGSFPNDKTWAGCYDMAGNVMEWTSTRADAAEGDRPPDFGDRMLVCGGSYHEARALHAATARDFETRSPDLGFRCALTVPTDPGSVQAILRRR